MANTVLEKNKNPVHETVMPVEAISFLCTEPGGVYVDATLGMGGHAEEILTASSSGAKVIGFDMDERAIFHSKQRLSRFNSSVVYQNKNFADIDTALLELGIKEVNGVIADLGMSSVQLELSGRGFSFLRDEPLDMRMDGKVQFTAYDLVNEMDADEISRVIKMYGEEKWAKKIAKAIVRHRQTKPISTSIELAGIVSEAIPKRFHPKKIHPATKTFQALRIAVNNELENLEVFLHKAVSLLKTGGRIVVISFHSLEDRIVKNEFKKLGSPCICPPGLPRCGCGKIAVLEILTRSPIKPQKEETLQNPRARSAKMRIGEKKNHD